MVTISANRSILTKCNFAPNWQVFDEDLVPNFSFLDNLGIQYHFP